ncbi:unnamed protein product [Pleuronectes platessa]|uniref:Uncharacterized protein n=1 Tax=Pleuronectes platessa TaxID=8262 RepID=A0A9N7V8U0_PLEPL|nr:unnamed protein product [Pleuronectes platessa]
MQICSFTPQALSQVEWRPVYLTWTCRRNAALPVRGPSAASNSFQLSANECLSAVFTQHVTLLPQKTHHPHPAALPLLGICTAEQQIAGSVTDLRKPVAATPPTGDSVLGCVAAALPGSSRHYAAGANRPSIYHWRGKEAERFSQRFYLRLLCRLYPEPPLSLVILARCLAGNQPSGPLRE